MSVEFSFEYQITSTIKEVFQQDTVSLPDSNPNVSINNDAVATVENTNPSFDFGTALLKYKQAGMPQQAYGLGIDYRDPKYWLGININYLADSYIDISPIVRTDGFILIPLAAFHSGSHRRKSEGVIEAGKFDPWYC
jgi:hypothetical protein